MTARSSVALALILTAVLGGCSTPRIDPETSGSLDRPPLEVFGHRFERRRLANGLEALAVRESGAETASVYVVYAVGTGDETDDVAGISHLTEHLLFSGTPTTPNGAHERFVESIGGEGNAFTRADYTFYYDHAIPLAELDRVLAMEADRVRGLSFETGAVEYERERLVREEEGANTGRQRREQRVDRAVFGPAGYGSQRVDDEGHTRAKDLDVSVVRDFYDRWYVPNRAAVVVVGDLDERRALDAVERAFDALPARPEADRMRRGDAQKEPRAPTTSRFEEDLTQARVDHAWIGPAWRSEAGDPTERLAFEVLERVYDARSSRVRVSSGDRMRADRITLTASGPDAEKRLREHAAAMRSQAITPDELRSAILAIEREWASAPLRGRPYFSLAGRMGILSAVGDPEYLNDGLDALRQLTPERVRTAAERWLLPEARFAVRFEPGGASPSTAAGDSSDSPETLARRAERAADSGDLAGAALAYQQLADSVDDAKMRVIALYSLAHVERRRDRLIEARAALLEALEIVEYPAVRSLLEEIDEELSTGERATATASAESATESASPPASGFGVANPESLAPEIVARAEQWMRRIEEWRGLPFRGDLRIEYGVEGEEEDLAGFYSPAEQRLVVMAGRSETFSDGTLLHEIFHALQDQHFDLARLHDEADSPDAHRALSALIEGEAMLAVSDLMGYDFLSHATNFDAYPVDRNRFDKVFRYGEGMRFVMALRESGGWSRVDEAWRRPPDRTVKILDPSLWLQGEEKDAKTRSTYGAYSAYLLLGGAPDSRPHARALATLVRSDRMEESTDGSPQAGSRRWTLEFATADAARLFRSLVSGREGVRIVPSERDEPQVTLDLDGTWLP